MQGQSEKDLKRNICSYVLQQPWTAEGPSEQNEPEVKGWAGKHGRPHKCPQLLSEHHFMIIVSIQHLALMILVLLFNGWVVLWGGCRFIHIEGALKRKRSRQQILHVCHVFLSYDLSS